MLLGYTVPYWPLELSFLQMVVGAGHGEIEVCLKKVLIGVADLAKLIVAERPDSVFPGHGFWREAMQLTSM